MGRSKVIITRPGIKLQVEGTSVKELIDYFENELNRLFIRDNRIQPYNHPKYLKFSKALRQKDKFREEYDRIMEEMDGLQFGISAVDTMLVDLNSKKKARTLNVKEWKKELDWVFEYIILKNVRELMVHVDSPLPKGEIARIVDGVRQKAPMNANLHVYTSNTRKSTLVEIFMGGEDLKRAETGDERFDDDDED